MTVLEEVPGAGERPGGSRIVVEQGAECAAVLVPPRPLPPVVGIGAGVLAFNLLAVLWMGIALFAFHGSVGVMAQIAPRDLPPPLRVYVFPLFCAWLALEGLGAASLLALLRPAFVRERWTFSADGVRWRQSSFGRTRTGYAARADAPLFRLKRDPQGLTASVLTLQTARGGSELGELQLGEHATEAEREWLCSVGNALLREHR